MRGVGRRFPAAVTFCFALALTAAVFGADDPDGSFHADVAVLCRAPHRLAGTPEHEAAASHVAARLREAGIATVVRQPFFVPQVRGACTLTTGGESYPLHAMQANLSQLPTTGPAPMTGRTIYVRDGSPEAYGDGDPNGSIVIVDYETGRRWRDAFAMGARAVIFVDSGAVPGDFMRYEPITADLPRYCMSRQDAGRAGLLEGSREATIRAAVTWARVESQNVLAWIPGTDPRFSMETDEVLVLSAQLDSFGQVPTGSRGARGAANCAALLQTARMLNAARPRRDVLVAFLGGEGRCLSGAIALYSAVARQRPFLRHNRTHLDFIREHENELAFRAAIIERIRAGEVFANRDEAGRRAIEILRREGAYQANQVRARLRRLRLARGRIAGGDGSATSQLESRIGLLTAEETRWNEARRALATGEPGTGPAECLDRIRQESVTQIEARRSELAQLVAQRKRASEIGGILEGKTIVLHLALDFGDSGPRWGIAHSDSGRVLPGAGYNSVGYYASVFGNIEKVTTRLRESGAAMLRLLEPETTKIQLWPSAYFPGRTLHAGQVASRFGIYGLRAATCHDPLARAGHPSDDPDHIDVARIWEFAEDAHPLIEELASTPALSLRQRIRPTADYVEPEWKGNHSDGNNAMTRSEGSAIADRPARGAMLSIPPMPRDVPGFDSAVRISVTEDGYFTLGPLQRPDPERWCCALYHADGRISAVNSPIAEASRIELFPCSAHTVVALAPPTFEGAKTTVLNAANDGNFLASSFYLMEQDVTTTIFTPTTARGVKIVNSFGLTLLNGDGETPGGAGFAVGDMWQAFPSEEYAARDLAVLNEHRLQILRERRITNDSLEWLHGLANAAAGKAHAAARTAVRWAEYGAARLLSRRVYGPVLDAMNDLVKAVVILLLLTIPFAFALERLLVGTPHIYRQIGWYCLFFLITFGVLYLVHPAFAIAAEPVIIFLAFVIILLSVIVIAILLQRFQAEIRAVQGLQSTVHSADVSRFGTVMAAVSMGISTMRRRPMRTTLTTVTVVLLTFSILSFASFDAQQGILRRYLGTAEDMRGIFVHHALWSKLSDQLHDIVKHVVRGKASVTPRLWVAPVDIRDVSGFSLLVARADGARAVPLKAMVGIGQEDLVRQPGLAQCCPNRAEGVTLGPDEIFLPPAAAEALDLRIDDPVLVNGHRLRFAGALDVEAMTRFVQIDGSPVMPVDYNDPNLQQRLNEIEKAEEGEAAEQANTQTDSAFLPCYLADDMGIVHWKAAEALRGSLVGIMVYPDQDIDVVGMAETLCRISPAPVYATSSEGVQRLYFTTVLETSGLSNLVIPIVLGGLIVFGTMLGSVTDREKEIYSFSALGLAPAHISMLFFAEAAVYAVVGGLGGYILAQVVAFGSGRLAEITAIRIPEMNYSSTNAIFAILVVMATVLLSTVYPAIVGSRSANPGVSRSWRLPRPAGDAWAFTFPFTVSDYDITGVMSFLHEHFSNFSDCSLGVFLAEGTHVYSANNTLNLQSKVATAPFDLGVTEDFRLTSLPSEIEGVDEVRIEIRRLSGTRGDWVRTNRPFISDLRKQFLIWRSLPENTMELYRRRTLVMLGRDAEGRSNGQEQSQQV